MTAYYDEHDRFNVEWLKHLMAANIIAPGEIDGRDIQDVQPSDLRGFTQYHFFAGIGVWSFALRSAGWPDEKRVWTGSCPCQPFSVSGKRAGASDERHLWPEFFRLIEVENPVTVFGEQVASDDGLAWLDLVSSDLEGQGYTIGAVDTPACGFGAPHRRQRLYWCAVDDSASARRNSTRQGPKSEAWDEARLRGSESGRGAGILADSDGRQPSNGRVQRSGQHGLLAEGSGPSELADPEHSLGRTELEIDRDAHRWDGFGGSRFYGDDAPCGCWDRNAFHRVYGMLLGEKCANYGDMGHASEQGLSERISDRRIQRETLGSRTGQTVVGGSGGLGDVDRSGSQPGNSAAEGNRHRDSAYTASFWADCEWLYCRDGKMRPTQPQLFPLAHGIANRVGKLRGYGNALVAPQAEAFVRAYLQVSEVVGRS